MKFEQKDFIPTTKEEIEAYKNLRPDFVKEPEHPRELILKLGKHITDRSVDKIFVNGRKTNRCCAIEG